MHVHSCASTDETRANDSQRIGSSSTIPPWSAQGIRSRTSHSPSALEYRGMHPSAVQEHERREDESHHTRTLSSSTPSLGGQVGLSEDIDRKAAAALTSLRLHSGQSQTVFSPWSSISIAAAEIRTRTWLRIRRGTGGRKSTANRSELLFMLLLLYVSPSDDNALYTDDHPQLVSGYDDGPEREYAERSSGRERSSRLVLYCAALPPPARPTTRSRAGWEGCWTI
jgi:hypothetical protein